MAEQNKKKVAIVTGDSRGIGRSIALELAKRDITVVINYNGSEERAKEVQKEIEENGGQAVIRRWNVSDYSACEEAVKAIAKELGSIDILVNNAGITKDGLLMGMSEADFDSVINVNLKGTFNMMRFVSRQMLRRRKCRTGQLCCLQSRSDWSYQDSSQRAGIQRNHSKRCGTWIY